MNNKTLKKISLSGFVRLTFLSVAATCLCVLLPGCKIENSADKKVQDLDFTVLKERDIPQDILDMISEKKQEAFQFTKTSGPYTYLAVGYGKQSTGGYSIQVEDVYLGENAVYVKTALLGPKKDEAVSDAESFPYVVVKIEARDETVIFK